MDIQSHYNKDKIALVAIGYNRIDSIKRLLGSLEKAHYNIDVPLYISIDASGCKPLYDYVNDYEWKHGDKYVSIKESRLGLRDHILSCGDLTKYFKAVIILEDDIYVSECFFEYIQQAVEVYGQDQRVGGISLYRPCMDRNLPVDYILDGNDTFSIQTVESWGQCWTEQMWSGFRKWYNNTPKHNFSLVDMPEFMKVWKKAWSKFYMAFQIEDGRHFIYPSVSLTTCFSEAGEHGNTSSVGQTVLLSGPKEYKLRPFDELTHYDIYTTNSDIYQWIGISKDDLCVDLSGYHNNTQKCRYILSPYKYPYKIIREFALSLRPIELNVKYNVEGTGLYLYDTTGKDPQKARSFSMPLAYYYIRQLNARFMIRYIIDLSISKLRARIYTFLKR